MKKLFYILSLLVFLSVSLLLVYSTSKFNKISYKDFSKPEIWKHHVNDISELYRYYNYGYKGIEFDVRYFQGKGIFVTHDTVSDNKIDSLISIKDYLSELGNKINYWVDFKNLDSKNVEQTIDYFNLYLDDKSILNNLYIESRDAAALGRLKEAFPNINTMLYIKRFGETRYLHRLYFYKFNIYKNNIDSVTTSIDRYNSVFIKDFKNLNLFVYDVNDRKIAEGLVYDGVDIILTDSIEP